MDIPQWSKNASINFLATKTQKTVTGATIRIIVSASDLTSGPNMNLPRRKIELFGHSFLSMWKFKSFLLPLGKPKKMKTEI